MDRQIAMKDMLPSDIKIATRSFVDALYRNSRDAHILELARNRHEGYGLLAERYVELTGADKSVDSAMKDCLKLLGSDDHAFQETVDVLYAAITELVIASARMGVQALNVASQTVERQCGGDGLPLLDAIDELDGSGLEDDSDDLGDLDGEDSDDRDEDPDDEDPDDE